MAKPRKGRYGTVRADGKVFYQERAGKEYWMTPEQWHRLIVAPAEAKKAATAIKRAEKKARQAEEESERKAKWEAQVAYWAATKDEREAAWKERQKARVEKLRKESPEILRQRERDYYERHKDCPEWQARRKAVQDRHAEKKRAEQAPAIAARKAERESKKQAEDEAKAQRKAERAARGEIRRLALLANPRKRRVVLTDAERAERKREERRNWKHRRRALLAGQECKATPSDIRKHREKAKGICFYCRKKFKSLTVDHIVPMVKGGGHTLDNIVFACHACNSEKRDLDPAEYAKSHGMLLV